MTQSHELIEAQNKIKQHIDSSLCNQTMTKSKTLSEAKEKIKKEVDLFLMFFIKTDLELYGKISSATISCFKTQKVEIPEKKKKFM